MTANDLNETARALVAEGKGILAADESIPTITKRFVPHKIESTPESRRAYREMLFSTSGIDAFIAGAILYDETIRQKSSDGVPLVELLTRQGIIPGIKVDEGAKPLAGSPGELVTEGLDGLRRRFEEYRRMGARFAKWRAVITIGDGRPSATCVLANAHALGRYAALAQEQGLVPIVEPEVLMDGGHTLSRCEEVTEQVLQAVFDQLFDQKVLLEGMLLKPNMVTTGHDCPKQASVTEVADATLRTLQRHVAPAVPGIVFLSGGQDAVLATEHLTAINQLDTRKPWKLSFSFGRALQDEALEAWSGKSENVPAAQRALYHRAQCEGAATMGKYSSATEAASLQRVNETAAHLH
jgi:fructose-bisphosphate aldolase class I